MAASTALPPGVRCYNQHGKASLRHPDRTHRSHCGGTPPRDEPGGAAFPQAVCGLLGDPFLLNRFARGEPVQIITRHWARAAEAA